MEEIYSLVFSIFLIVEYANPPNQLSNQLSIIIPHKVFNIKGNRESQTSGFSYYNSIVNYVCDKTLNFSTSIKI